MGPDVTLMLTRRQSESSRQATIDR